MPLASQSPVRVMTCSFLKPELLRHLLQQVDAQWPSSEATDAAVAEAIEPLDEALDQIDRLLDAGRDLLV